MFRKNTFRLSCLAIIFMFSQSSFSHILKNQLFAFEVQEFWSVDDAMDDCLELNDSEVVACIRKVEDRCHLGSHQVLNMHCLRRIAAFWFSAGGGYIEGGGMAAYREIIRVREAMLKIDPKDLESLSEKAHILYSIQVEEIRKRLGRADFDENILGSYLGAEELYKGNASFYKEAAFISYLLVQHNYSSESFKSTVYSHLKDFTAKLETLSLELSQEEFQANTPYSVENMLIVAKKALERLKSYENHPL